MRFSLPLAGLGDVIAATAIVREYKRTYPAEIIEGVDCNWPAVFDNNPHLGHGQVATPKTVRLHFDKTHGSVGHIPYTYAAQAGIQLHNCLPEIHLTPDEISFGWDLVKRHPAVAIDPWARWASRRWPPARYNALVEALRARGWYVVEIGAPVPDYEGNTNDVRLDCDRQLYGEQSVREAAATLAACDLFFGNESGSAHMAAAVGTPACILYSMAHTIKAARLYANQLAAVTTTRACPSTCRELCSLDHIASCLLDVSVEHALARIELAARIFKVRHEPTLG